MVSNKEQLPSLSPVRSQDGLEHTKQLEVQASICFLLMHTLRHSDSTNDYAVPSLFQYISIFPFKPIKKQLISIYKAISSKAVLQRRMKRALKMKFTNVKQNAISVKLAPPLEVLCIGFDYFTVRQAAGIMGMFKTVLNTGFQLRSTRQYDIIG